MAVEFGGGGYHVRIPTGPHMSIPAPAPVPPADRRVAPRFQPALGTVCRFRTPARRVGLVCNISESGISMLVADPPPAGVAVEAELTAEEHDEGLPVVLHVVHVRPADTGDYLLGAKFAAPLLAEQMKPFLAAGL